jgi:hypothetical protein
VAPAIVGPGNIGTDLLAELRRSSVIEVRQVLGVVESDGLAQAHRANAPRCAEAGIRDHRRGDPAGRGARFFTEPEVGVSEPVHGFLAAAKRPRPGRAAGHRAPHRAALRAGDRVRAGPRPRRTPRHRGGRALRDGGRRGGHRGPRLPLHRLPVHDARRRRGQHVRRPLRCRGPGQPAGHRPAPGRGGAGEERAGRGHRLRRGRARHPAAAVAWLARALRAGGEGLRTGEIVLSGG